MAEKTRESIVKSKLWVINIIFLAGILSLGVWSLYMNSLITRNVVYPISQNQLVASQKNGLKALVDVEAGILADKLKGAKTKEDQINLMIAETDPIRFFDDASGYFFTYDLNGVRVNVPIDKSQNGKNLMLLEDAYGVRLIEEIVKASKNGTGFVKYHFKKPDKTVHPKLSYVKTIPGTEFLIGTGVYTEDESETSGLVSTIEEGKSAYFAYGMVVFLGIIGLTIIASWLMSRSIIHSVESTAKQ